MTDLVSLPIVPGGVGAGVATSNLSSKKVILATGLTGTVNVQGSNDGGVTWCPVASFSGPTWDQQVIVNCAMMRVDATKGGVTSLQVIAERGLIRSSVVPTPPSSGPGAAIDISAFGCPTTVIVQNKAGAGSINIEISGDGVKWSAAFSSFAANGCQTKDISARYMRANGNGATADISVACEESALSAITQPVASIVYREGATGGNAPGGNVYTTEESAREACESTKHLGTRLLVIDSGFTAHVNGQGRPACPITTPWDLDDVILSNVPGGRLDILNDGVTTDGRILNCILVDGQIFDISYDGTVPGVWVWNPAVPGVAVQGGNSRFFNTNPLAAPLFKGTGFNFIAYQGRELGGIGAGNVALAAPIIDLNNGFFVFVGAAGFMNNNALVDNSLTKTATMFWRFLDDNHMAQQGTPVTGLNAAMDYDFPLLAGTVGVHAVVEHSDRAIMNAIVPFGASPYGAKYNEIVQADTTLGDVVVLLPDSHGIARGGRVIVKNSVGINKVVVTATGADTVEGVATKNVAVAGQAQEFRIDGPNANWVHVATS